MKLNIRIIAVALVFLLSVGFGVWWFQQYKQKSRASAAPPRLFFSIPYQNVTAGNPFDLYLNVNPNSSPFYSFEFTFAYDSANVALANEADPVSNVLVLDDALIGKPIVDPVAHTITLRGTRTKTPYAGGEAIQLVKISFVMKPEAPFPLRFNWDPTTNIAGQATVSKEDLEYPNITPTVPASSGASPVAVLTPVVEHAEKPAPIGASPAPQLIGAQDQMGTTSLIFPREDRLYINSIITNSAPFRYEQSVILDAGTYNLLIGARVRLNKGRGMLVAIHCNESDCGGGKMRNDIIAKTPVFPVKEEFSEMQQTVIIPQEGNKKNYTIRIYCEDGTECEIDYITLEDAWGSNKVANAQFSDAQLYTDPRKQPNSWMVDETANLFGTVDPAAGKNGALIINNPIK